MNDGKKVLVVSQNHHFLNIIENNLAKYNFRVKSTKSRDEELVRVLTETTPDLTILDTPLISMDGIRELICIRDTLDTPIMMLSTQGAKADTVRTLSIGSYSHPFIKPITFEQLMMQINNLLNKN
jgi:DNA-binding response OmpR family regulator